MNKSKKLKILLTSFAAVATTGVVATTIASCGTSNKLNDNPTATSLAPTNDTFTSQNLFGQVKYFISISDKLPANADWVLSPNIGVSNIQSYVVLDNATTASTADISGIIIINSVARSYQATAVYHNNIKHYEIVNLDIQPATKTLTPATPGKTPTVTPTLPSTPLTPATIPVSPLTPATIPMTPLAPANNTFTSENLAQPVTIAVVHKLEAHDNWTVMPKINVSNVQHFTILADASTAATADIDGIVIVNTIARTYSASAVYHSNTNTYEILNVVVQDTTSKLTPARNYFTDANLEKPVSSFITTYFAKSHTVRGKVVKAQVVTIKPTFTHENSKPIYDEDHKIIGYSEVVTGIVIMDHINNYFIVQVNYTIGNKTPYIVDWAK